jgi:glycosyltransferase involved in cell wall biosynthesis
MRILYHHRTRAEDAQGIHISEIINAFQCLGHQVEVAGLLVPAAIRREGNTGSYLSAIASKMPPFLYEIMEIFYNIYGFYMLRKKILKFKPSFIYERYALNTFAGVLASKLYNIPIIEEVNAPLSYEKKRYSNLIMTGVAQYLEKMICTHSFKTIVVSTPLMKIMANLGVPLNKLEVISNGVNERQFNPGIKGNKVREKFNLGNKTILGFVGWFREWHGLEELLHTYSEKNLFKKNIYLLLVGDGPAYASLVKIAQKYSMLNEGVIFTGPIEREKIPQYVAAFDLALQPDVTDYASPIKLFEYISMGKGVIAPDKENIREILGDDYAGLFKAGNWQSMGEVITKLTSSEEQIQKFGAETYALFSKKKYLWVENAKKTIKLISPAIGKH